MSKTYTQLAMLKDKVSKLFTQNKGVRLLIPATTLAEFPTQEDRDEYIKNKLIANGFAIEKPITSYKRIPDDSLLFEQEVGGEE